MSNSVIQKNSAGSNIVLTPTTVVSNVQLFFGNPTATGSLLIASIVAVQQTRDDSNPTPPIISTPVTTDGSTWVLAGQKTFGPYSRVVGGVTVYAAGTIAIYYILNAASKAAYPTHDTFTVTGPSNTGPHPQPFEDYIGVNAYVYEVSVPPLSILDAASSNAGTGNTPSTSSLVTTADDFIYSIAELVVDNPIYAPGVGAGFTQGVATPGSDTHSFDEYLLDAGPGTVAVPYSASDPLIGWGVMAVAFGPGTGGGGGGGTPILHVTPSSLSFSAVLGGANPLSQNVLISNGNGGTLNWSVASDSTWLSALFSAGSGDYSDPVLADITSLGEATYTGHLTVTAPGATGSPQTVTVTLKVSSSGGGGGGGGGGGDLAVTLGCGKCTSEPLLNAIPGFSDLPDSVLAAENPAFGLHLGELADNASFGMVRLEIFPCVLKHGDTVPLPVSCRDGYVYSREELLYFWTIENTVDPSTGWISGPDSLWFGNWNVNQLTGEVFSEEWYERSSTADSRLAASSNDGSLRIFTIGQRLKTSIFLQSQPSYVAVDESEIATDKPYRTDLLARLNQNAKFGVVGTEVFYLGEFTNGQTVTLPISPIDGYTYSAPECKFLHCWRWTPSGSAYSQPPGPDEQAAPFTASVNSSGVCSIAVSFSTSGGNGIINETGYGRIAVFAFATRSGTPGSAPLAAAFTEIDVGFFFPGESVRASTVLTIKRNIDEAILTPEFFGPTSHIDTDIIALPVSPVDGYLYSRDELQYICTWTDTKNNLGGTHNRLPFFYGGVEQSSGVVTLRTYRLPPGGGYVDDGSNGAISVIIVATRSASHPEITLPTNTITAPTDYATYSTDVSGDTVNGV